MENETPRTAHEHPSKKPTKSWKTRLGLFAAIAADKLATAAVCLALTVIYQKVTSPKSTTPVA